jgi:hypothetical protein
MLQPSAMRLPTWRWRIVLHVIAAQVRYPYEMKQDLILCHAADFYHDFKSGSKNPLKLLEEYPDVFTAMRLYEDTRPWGPRWFIEAMLSSNQTSEEVATHMAGENPLTYGAVEAYKKLFFDTDQYKDSATLFRLNVINLSRCSGTGADDCDYVWKEFARYWGVAVFLKHMVGVEPLENKHSTWIRKIVRDTLSVQTAQMVRTNRERYNKDMVEVLRLAGEFWNVPDDKINESEKKLKESFVDEMQQYVHTTIRDAKARYSKIENPQLQDLAKVSLS